MKTYKRYVVNQTYPEGCITECYLMEESILYAMNYMPDSIERSHKQGHGKWMDEDGECAYLLIKMGRYTILLLYNTSKLVNGC